MAIATHALAAYALENSRFQLVRDFENLIYKVCGDRLYALRICSNNVNQQQLKTEVYWLDAIRGDTDLLVPKPVSNKYGELITHVDNRLYVIFEWLEGEPVSQIMSPAAASRIGEMMASLHRHAEQYQPKNYQGSRFDYDYYFGNDAW
jgi:Ser/Thr protein kinase RdoA (MazF antagonist)